MRRPAPRLHGNATDFTPGAIVCINLSGTLVLYEKYQRKECVSPHQLILARDARIVIIWRSSDSQSYFNIDAAPWYEQFKVNAQAPCCVLNQLSLSSGILNHCCTAVEVSPQEQALDGHIFVPSLSIGIVLFR